jgi:hypothetical protein
MGTPVRSRPFPVKSRPDAANSVAHSPLGSFDDSKFSSSSLSSWGDRFQPASVSSAERTVSSRVTPARNVRRTGSSPQAVVQLGFDVSSCKSRQSVPVACQDEHPRSLLQNAFRQSIPASTLQVQLSSCVQIVHIVGRSCCMPAARGIAEWQVTFPQPHCIAVAFYL